MDEYEYKGHIITETEDGYWQVGQYEFPSYDEALDWIDSEEELPEVSDSRTFVYRVHYVDTDGYPDQIDIISDSRESAERQAAQCCDVDYYTGTYVIGEV